MQVQQEIAAIQFQRIIARLVYFSRLIVIMAAHSNVQTIIFFCGGYCLPFLLLILAYFQQSMRLDVYHTSTHDVALVHILNACLKCAAHRWLKIQDAKIAVCAPSHNFVGLYFHN